LVSVMVKVTGPPAAVVGLADWLTSTALVTDTTAGAGE